MAKKKKGPTPPRKWQPLRPGVPTGITLDASSDEVWVNDRYIVHVDYADAEEGRAGFLHVSLRNRANTAWAHDWRDLQRIKNEIAGPEREACELYPAESRLVDEANQFHLWVLPEGEVYPFGYAQRQVSDRAWTLSDEEVASVVDHTGHDEAAVRKALGRARQRKMQEIEGITAGQAP